MGTKTIDEDPEFLRDLISKLKPSIPDEKNAKEASRRLRLSWEGFRRERNHYLAMLHEANETELSQVEDHYKQKLLCLTAERKWLRASKRAFSVAFKTKRDYENKLANLKDVRDERMGKVLNLAFGFPDIRIGFSKEERKFNDAIYKGFLESAITADRIILSVVDHIINSYKKRRLYRRLYRVGLEKFWGFLILTLLFEQIIQERLEKRIPEFLVSSLPYPWLWRALFLVGFLFILYEVKEKFVNPAIHKHSIDVHKKHLSKDILDAAEAQTRLEAIYLREQAVKEWADEMSDETVESAESEEPRLE